MAFGKQGSMGRGIGKQGQAYLGTVQLPPPPTGYAYKIDLSGQPMSDRSGNLEIVRIS
jgi:hypothetical protein